MQLLQVLNGGDLLGTLPLLPSCATVGCGSLQHSSPLAPKPACSWQSAMPHCWQACLKLAGLGLGDAAMASGSELEVPAVWTSFGILPSRGGCAMAPWCGRTLEYQPPPYCLWDGSTSPVQPHLASHRDARSDSASCLCLVQRLWQAPRLQWRCLLELVSPRSLLMTAVWKMHLGPTRS